MQKIRKNWIALFSANLVGILNDNYLKNIIIFVGSTWVLPDFITKSNLITFVSAALVIPYLLLTPLSGRLAIRFYKQKVYRYCKLCEFPIMLFASFGIISQSIWMCICAVFLMGVQTCLSSPSKYGTIKDIGGVEKIEYGNGMIETMAFLGILLGTVLASIASDIWSVHIICAFMLLFALLGFYCVYKIDVQESSVEETTSKTINPFRFMKESYEYAKQFPDINGAVFGSSLFWLIGGMLQMNMVIHGTETLGLSNTTTGIAMSCAAIGIALGCTFAGKITKQHNELKMIIVGIVGMLLLLLAIIFFNPNILIFSILIFFVAFFGGMFNIPCMAIVQRAPTGRRVGDLIAYLNFVTFVFVLIGSVIFFVITILTHENSIAVFSVIAIILAIALFYFLFVYKKGHSRKK